MRVHLRTLGCRLNQSEIEAMARQFSRAGHDVVDAPEAADRIIVNTCAVTQDAVRGSRKLVRALNRANPNAEVIVTGCYAQIAPDEIVVIPGVSSVIDNLGKDTLVRDLTGVEPEAFDDEPLARHPAALWGGRTRAFVKVQDGCDNACTFCVTTIARGAGRSRSVESVVREVQLLYQLGYREAVLTGVHLGSYGHDRGEQDGLSILVRALLADTDMPRLRLSSLEPWDLRPDFFSLWDNARLCPHLHLPLQSGCDATLRRMARRTTQASFRALVDAARARIPEPCITSDIIVGFPGETDEEFAESMAFVEAIDFAGLHVFRYSKRPGTAAARLRGHISEATKKIRSERMIALGMAGERRYMERHRGARLPVLWEQIAGVSEAGFHNVGYTSNYIRVRCVHRRPLTNQITAATLLDYDAELQQMIVVPE